MSSQLDNGGEAVALDLALRRSGGVHLPLPGFFTAAQVLHAQRDAGIDAHVSALRDARGSELGSGLRIHAVSGQSERVALPAATAVIIYTSGSTGKPKGVCLSAEHLDRVSAAIVDALAGSTPNRHLSLLPLSVLLEQVAGVGAALLADAEVVLPSLADTGLIGAAQLDATRMARAPPIPCDSARWVAPGSAPSCSPLRSRPVCRCSKATGSASAAPWCA